MKLDWQIFFYIAVYLSSGLVVSHALKSRRMKVASYLFRILFFVFAFYIPFYFGGNLMLTVIDDVVENVVYKAYFAEFLTGILSAPFMLFKSVSLVSALIAIVAVTATFIVAVTVVFKIAEFIYKKCIEVLGGFDKKPQIIKRPFTFFRNDRHVYLVLERLLN